MRSIARFDGYIFHFLPFIEIRGEKRNFHFRDRDPFFANLRFVDEKTAIFPGKT